MPPGIVRSLRGDGVGIVGAGLLGLAAGYRLAQQGIPVAVYEASSRVGGLAGTTHIGGVEVVRRIRLERDHERVGRRSLESGGEAGAKRRTWPAVLPEPDELHREPPLVGRDQRCRVVGRAVVDHDNAATGGEKRRARLEVREEPQDVLLLVVRGDDEDVGPVRH